MSESDRLLISRIRQSDADAWQELIQRYEGRLLAFAASRVGDRVAAEDIVQECFIGFLTSLPNYDERRELESYLFSICAYKLTDHLRREGRRPVIRMESGSGGGDDGGPGAAWQLPGRARAASSIARSVERKGMEERAMQQAMAEQIQRWKAAGSWAKLKCDNFVANAADEQQFDALQ
ncbi:MAG: RNA polymerase sigma factor, partial [Planctomycetota bacterium]